jgi:hypothetical protein
MRYFVGIRQSLNPFYFNQKGTKLKNQEATRWSRNLITSADQREFSQ